MRVLVVPDGDPRTKPRAIQYALQFAHGDYVVVYDAKGVPEPDRLRRALAALMAEPGRLGCLQARLNIYNSRASWLTQQFTIEYYTALFDCILPTLERFELPVPLGRWRLGPLQRHRRCRSRHKARASRLAGILGSTTWEEAPPTFRIWLSQRKRWLKGWMQTYLVHIREPRRLWRELGAKRFLGLQVLMGGLILSPLVHPRFYALLAFDLWEVRLLGVSHSFAGETLLWLGAFNLVAGYVSAIALGSVAAARRGRVGLAHTPR
jgi:cellulose synthase/poly-beta-1,6-N-acetylglucosamine synthase-like glycosyltransferase